MKTFIETTFFCFAVRFHISISLFPIPHVVYFPSVFPRPFLNVGCALLLTTTLQGGSLYLSQRYLIRHCAAICLSATSSPHDSTLLYSLCEKREYSTLSTALLFLYVSSVAFMFITFKSFHTFFCEKMTTCYLQH